MSIFVREHLIVFEMEMDELLRQQKLLVQLAMCPAMYFFHIIWISS